MASQLLRLTFAKALQECVEMMATLYHTTARTTRSTTDVHTNINQLQTHRATHHKTNHAPAAARRWGGDGVLRGARVQDARSKGCTSRRFCAVGTAKPKTCLPETTEEGRAEQDGRVESPQPSVVHVGISKLGEPRSCCSGALALEHLQETSRTSSDCKR